MKLTIDFRMHNASGIGTWIDRVRGSLFEYMKEKEMQKSYSDLKILKQKYNISYIMSILSNRGFHALLFYRISHFLYRYKIPILPLILTRFIQIIYSIDIDYKAKIEGG